MKTAAKLRALADRQRRRRRRMLDSTAAWWRLGLGPRADPPAPAAGRCAICGRPRPLIARRHGCPFCSSECCQLWHDPAAVRWRCWALGRGRP